MSRVFQLWSVPDAADPDDRREVRLLYGVTRPQVVVYALAALLLAIPGVTGPVAAGASAALLLSSAALQVAALALAHRGRIAAAGRLVAGTTLATAMLAVTLIGGLRGTLSATLMLAVLVAGVLRGWRTAAWAAAGACVYAAAEHAAERAGLAPLVQAEMYAWAAVISTLAMIALAAALLALYAREMERAVAERRASETRALATEHALAEIVRHVPDGIVETDEEGRILSVNQALARESGYAEAELVGRRVTELTGIIEPEVLAKVADGLGRVLAGERVQVELPLRRRDGSRVVVETNGARSTRPDGSTTLLFVVRDVTARIVGQQERRRLEDELLDARRMESLGRLAGGIAHDFRNLLTPILMNARALGDGPTADLHALAGEIETAAQRANALTGQLLAVARRQLLEPRLLDLCAVVRGLEPILRRVVREDVRFELRLPRALPPVRADRSQLEQVVVNLVANACDAMPEGGQLLVAAAEVSAEPPAGGGAAPHVALLVSDTGRGMSEEVRRRVFEPFFSTKDAGRGVGLGLATVHGIVTQSGGTVQVESEPGRGSTFRVLLPVAAGEVEADRPAPATLPSFAPGTRVLVVDDAPLVRGTVARILRLRGLEVIEAEDGFSALAAARTAAGGLDLLVSDVVMPGMDGPALAAELRRGQPGLAVLFMSGYADQDVLARGQAAPDLELLPKPFTPDELLTRVADVLRRRPPGARREGAP